MIQETPESIDVVTLEKLEERIMPAAHSVLSPELLAKLAGGDDFGIAFGSYDSYCPKPPD